MAGIQISCFVLSYLLALACALWRVEGRSRLTRTAMLVAGWAGLTAHTLYLQARSHQADLPPLLSSTRDWLLVLAWIGVLFWLVTSTVDRRPSVGLFMLPPVLLLIGASLFVGDEPQAVIADRALRRWGMLHAGALVLGSGAVLCGFVSSIMYLWQHKRLRTKSAPPKGLILPSLERLAATNWWTVIIAVPLLTVGLVAGVILGQLSQRAGDQEFSFSDPIVVAHTVVWIGMAALFYRVVSRPERSGRNVAWLTVWAFAFLIATIIGLQVLTGRGTLESFHGSRDQPVNGTEMPADQGGTLS